MLLTKLHLVNFRNYIEEEFSFHPKVNIILGENAAGKTSILEALSLFSLGTSVLATNDREMIQDGKLFLRVTVEQSNLSKDTLEFILLIQQPQKCKYCIPQEINKNETQYLKGETYRTRKLIRINKKPIKQAEQLANFYQLIAIWADEIKIINEGPLERRKYFDYCIAQLYPYFIHLMRNYNKLLSLRNIILKKGNLKDGELLVWSKQLADVGSKVIVYRKKYLSELIPLIKYIINFLQFDNFSLEINYIALSEKNLPSEEQSIKETFLSKLLASQIEERKKGYTLWGPHKDCFELILQGKSLKKYGSAGEKKLVLIILKLAHILLSEKVKQWLPIILLDDFLNHLDKENIEKLLAFLKTKGQLFITHTENSPSFKIFPEVKFFYVSNGKLYKTELVKNEYI